MLSRVADAIYWLSRYIERAENIARFVDVNLHLALDQAEPDEDRQWAPLVAVTGDRSDFSERYEVANQKTVVRFLTYDRANPNSIYSCLWAARENARSVREVISSEMWEQVNRSLIMLRDAQTYNPVETDPAAFFSHFREACHLFWGITDATMTHGEPWNFARLGRMLERADKTSRILDVKYFIILPTADYVGSPYDNLQWVALLKSISGYEMYRKCYHDISPDHVAEFLLLNDEFPRSIRFCLAEADQALHAISGWRAAAFSNRAEQQLGRLRSELAYADVDGILAGGLHQYLDRFQAKLNGVGNAVFDTFFAIQPIRRQTQMGSLTQ